MKTTKTVIVALGLLIGGLAQAEIFDDFSSGNLMDNWSTTSTDTGLKWTIKDGVLAFSSADTSPGSATYASRKKDFKLAGTPEEPLVMFIELPANAFSKQTTGTGQHEAFTFGVIDADDRALAGTINYGRQASAHVGWFGRQISALRFADRGGARCVPPRVHARRIPVCR